MPVAWDSEMRTATHFSEPAGSASTASGSQKRRPQSFPPSNSLTRLGLRASCRASRQHDDSDMGVAFPRLAIVLAVVSLLASACSKVSPTTDLGTQSLVPEGRGGGRSVDTTSATPDRPSAPSSSVAPSTQPSSGWDFATRVPEKGEYTYLETKETEASGDSHAQIERRYIVTDIRSDKDGWAWRDLDVGEYDERTERTMLLTRDGIYQLSSGFYLKDGRGESCRHSQPLMLLALGSGPNTTWRDESQCGERRYSLEGALVASRSRSVAGRAVPVVSVNIELSVTQGVQPPTVLEIRRDLMVDRYLVVHDDIETTALTGAKGHVVRRLTSLTPK